MKLEVAEYLAKHLFAKYGLKKWKFVWMKTKSLFGQTQFGKRVIRLSIQLTEMNDAPEVLDVILHEIAHALLEHRYKNNSIRQGHGPEWKAKAKFIGCRPEPYYDKQKVKVPYLYRIFCKYCGYESFGNKKSKTLACKRCCKRYNKGKYSKDFILIYEDFNSKTPMAPVKGKKYGKREFGKAAYIRHLREEGITKNVKPTPKTKTVWLEGYETWRKEQEEKVK